MYDNFHFAPGVKTGNLLLMSGQVGSDASGKCPEDFTEQFRLAFQHIEAILTEAGGDLSNIVELTSYHIGMREHLREFIAVKDEMISEPYPAWTAIGCTELAMPGAVVEIRAQAVLS
tara:strand:- start:4405 stop:4755 length:351 start_codon:yes stop_codon:yes gene_type:complete